MSKLLGAPLALPSGATLPNRLAKAAMSEVLADPETQGPTDELIRLYERWARSGAGLLITGHVIAVIAAHDRAVKLLPKKHQLTGQLPLLVVMVGFTIGGLYLLFGA